MKKSGIKEIKQEPEIPLELQYLEDLIRYRLSRYFPEENDYPEPAMPAVDKWQLFIKTFVRDNKLNDQEALLLLIALTPHIAPDLFDKAIQGKLNGKGDFLNIGGVRGKNSRGFLPTGETALFLLSGDDWNNRLKVQQLFWADHLFGMRKVLWLEELTLGEPSMSGRIIMSQDYIETFTYGKPVPPHFSMSFPAKLIETELTWDDLVINNELRQQIKELESWVTHNAELMGKWGMQSRLRKGYRTLFYGPPGTGKTFSAGLLGKYTKKDVYKIDLSMIVSKYIGETEKNLELLFARAEDKGWILFFDEADALFGKRTSVRDAHDKYANQEVSYLLQRIEDYNGLIILATNMKNNIDDAFIRRFNSILKFSFPDASERSLIWRKSFPKSAFFAEEPLNHDQSTMDLNDPNLVKTAERIKKYELSGGNIMNVVHYSSLKAVERRYGKKNTSVAAETRLVVYLSDMLDGIRREMIKEGKPFG